SIAAFSSSGGSTIRYSASVIASRRSRIPASARSTCRRAYHPHPSRSSTLATMSNRIATTSLFRPTMDRSADMRPAILPAPRFALVTATLAGLGLATVFVSMWVEQGRLDFLEVKHSWFEPSAMWGRRAYPAWYQDAAVPWSAGARIPGVLPILLFLTGSYW